MTDLTLTRTALSTGVYEAHLTLRSDRAIDIVARHDGQDVGDVCVTRNADASYHLKITLPATLMSQGIQTMLIIDKAAHEIIDSVTIRAGDNLDEDSQAELDFLRAELDMLKRAFRRHCAEQMANK